MHKLHIFWSLSRNWILVLAHAINSSCQQWCTLLERGRPEQFTTGFYPSKFDEIGYQVCSSSSIVGYEHSQNPEFQNPAIRGFWEKRVFVRSNGQKKHFQVAKSGFRFPFRWSEVSFPRYRYLRILRKNWNLTVLIPNYWTAKTDLVANFIELGHVCSQQRQTYSWCLSEVCDPPLFY